MIFWIILTAVAVITVGTFIYQWQDWGDFGFSFAGALLGLLISGIGGVILMLVLSIWFGPTHQSRGSEDHELVALQTSSGVEGRFFLGSGYINGERTLNFITNDDGAFRVQSADADVSTIYQDSQTPTVTVYQWTYANPWFAPWDFGRAQTYDFHVPAGSILSDYTIDNG